MFNQQSPRRGETFVTKKIVKALCKIKFKKQNTLYLGNLYAKRDWGHAEDYIKVMWLMLQKKKPADYVVGTGKTYSVREFVKIAFEHVGLNYKDYVKKDAKLFRPAEVDVLLADANKAKKILNWKPKHNLENLVEIMVDFELSKLS